MTKVSETEQELMDKLFFRVAPHVSSKANFILIYKNGGSRNCDHQHYYLWKMLVEEAEKRKELEASKAKAGREALRRERKRLIELLTRAEKDFPQLNAATLAFAIDVISMPDAETKIFGGKEI